ncbi:amino acid permease-domain-containing protein [Daedaleopsis nitida]|nr:amino acid permease-domain-containing protein [Daedaleopsis nitida]
MSKAPCVFIVLCSPSNILALSGSVGLALFIWVAGMLIPAAGMAIYLEFGTNLPRNGGEKNYLEFVFTRPKHLATGFYASGGAGNIVVFGEYILHATNVEVDRCNQRVDKPHNFPNAKFEGTTGSSYGVVTVLYNVIWSYTGYFNANYAMSEMKDPVRTLKMAAPIAIISVRILYMLVNIAYFAAVSREEIATSGRILVASFFRDAVSVALSAFGNVLSVIFTQGRLVQELGCEGILPWSRVWASNKPFNAPLAGLSVQWAVSVIIMLAPPPGDAYDFIPNVVSYPLSTAYNWHPPIKATLPVTLFFLLSNIYLSVYEIVGTGVILAGGM